MTRESIFTFVPDVVCEAIEFVMRFLRFYYYSALHLIHADAANHGSTADLSSSVTTRTATPRRWADSIASTMRSSVIVKTQTSAEERADLNSPVIARRH